MKIYDPFLFLIGDKAAIKRIAGNYWSLLVGLILVISAGVARNYDHIYFKESWEWVFGPIIASLVSCVIVYVFGMPRVWLHSDSKLPFLSFLTVYWMTAPCAWIYGIPVESVTDIITATKWNIAFLSIVSFWRVALMIRCLMVLTEMKFTWGLLSILLPASFVSCVASFFKGISLVGIMGGVRLPPETLLLQKAAQVTLQYSFFLFCILLVIKIIAHKKQPKRYPKPLPWQSRPKFPLGASILSCLILSGSTFFISGYQEKVKNTKELSRILAGEKNMADAFEFIKNKDADDFSLIHNFPPYSGYTYRREEYEQLKEIMDQPPSVMPAWARKIWYRDYTLTLLHNHIFEPKALRVDVEGEEIVILLDRNKVPERVKITAGADDSEVKLENKLGQYFILKLEGEKVIEITELEEEGPSKLWPRL